MSGDNEKKVKKEPAQKSGAATETDFARDMGHFGQFSQSGKTAGRRVTETTQGHSFELQK